MSEEFMRQAIELAVNNVRENRGGPFAALVVRDGVVVAAGTNLVTTRNDPTAHAEMVAIREACRTLGDFQLTGCDLYTTCEPCPMCLGAVYWARPARVFFASSSQEAAAAGFDDSLIYEQVGLPYQERTIPMIPLLGAEARHIFAEWEQKPDKTRY